MNTIEPPLNTRVYLHVPYSEKDDAKKLGCRWDSDRRKWYCIDSDYGKSNVTLCINRWNNPAPYKIINKNNILLINISDDNRGYSS